MVTVLNSLTAHSQPSQPAKTDSVTISRAQQIKCIKCLQNAPLKDSIISEQISRIEIKDSIISLQAETLQKADSTVRFLDDQFSDCKEENVDLERKKKNGWKIGIPIGAGLGGFLGWLIGNKTK